MQENFVFSMGDKKGMDINNLVSDFKKRGANVAKAAYDKSSQLRAIAAEKSSEWSKAKPKRSPAVIQSSTVELFGAHLNIALKRSNEILGVNDRVPRILTRSIEYIQAHGMKI
jgi:hypothetical protein